MADPTYPYPAPPTPAAPPKRTGRTVLLVVAGLLGLCCLGGVIVAVAALSKGDSGSSSPQGPNAAGLNTPVRDGNFEFVVSSVSCGHPAVTRGIFSKQAQGQYCIVELSVRNIGNEPRTFADGFQKAFGPDGTSYGADSGAALIANEGGVANWNLINPGNQIAGKIVYDIPTSATINRLELHDAALSGGVAVAFTAS